MIYDDLTTETGVLPGAPVPVSAPLVERLDWDAWGAAIAQTVSLRADCSRRQVGAVILDEHHRPVSFGYNSSWPGGPSCLKGECPRASSSVAPGSSYSQAAGLCYSIHAEANALLHGGLDRTRGATMYVNHLPCPDCSKLIQAAGIARVVWPGGNRTY